MEKEKNEVETPVVNPYSYYNAPEYDDTPIGKLVVSQTNPQLLVDEKLGVVYIIVRLFDRYTGLESFKLKQLNYPEGTKIEGQ